MQARTDIPGLRLKHHVFFKEIPGGTLFDAGRSSFVLQGNSLYPVIRQIMRHMDAGCAADEIRASLPGKLQAFFDRMMNTLCDHGMLLEAPVAGEDALVPGHATQFVRFLQDNLSEPDCSVRFTRWRSQRVLVAGHGYSLKAVLNVLVESGVGHISIALDAGGDAPLRAAMNEELSDILARHGRLPGDGFEWLAAGGDLPWPRSDLVLYVADTYEPQHADRCMAYARAAEVAYLMAAVCQGHALVVPPAEGAPSALPCCLELLPQLTGAGQEGAHSPASCALMGSVAAHNALQHHFGIRRDFLSRHALTVSPWLEVKQHALVLPSGGGRSGRAGPGAASVVPAARQLSPYEQLRLDAAPWFDPLLGRFDASAGKTLRQLPLFLEAIDVRFARSADTPKATALGWGIDAEEAALRALAEAFRLCAQAELPGPRLDVAFDYPQWYKAALASAIVRSPGFAANRHHVEFDAITLSSPRALLLVKLLCLYRPGGLMLQVYWLPGLPAYRAECHGGGALLAEAHGSDALTAIEDAIGSACCRWQLGSPAAFPEPTVAQAIPTSIADPAAWIAQLAPENPALVASLNGINQLWQNAGMPADTVCGRVNIDQDVCNG